MNYSLSFQVRLRHSNLAKQLQGSSFSEIIGFFALRLSVRFTPACRLRFTLAAEPALTMALADLRPVVVGHARQVINPITAAIDIALDHAA
jgi:hypothetical protein